MERKSRYVAEKLLSVASDMQRSSVFDDPESEARVRDACIDRMLLLAAVLKGEKKESDYEALAAAGYQSAITPDPSVPASNGESEAVVASAGSESTVTKADVQRSVELGRTLSSSGSSTQASGLSNTYTPAPFRTPPPTAKRNIFTHRAIDSDDEFSPLNLK